MVENIWKKFKEAKLYCINDPNNTLSLLGADDFFEDQKTSHSRIALQVERCQNSSTITGT